MKRKKGLEAEHSERDGIQRCLFNNVLSNVPVCVDCVQQECYRLLDMAAPMDTHVDVTGTKQATPARRSDLWYELRIRVVTEGSSATVRAHDVRHNRVVRRRLGLWRELRNHVVKEGDASSLLVTSSLCILVASDDGISHGDTARCADAGNC
ncbi:hypothetical protein Tco_0774978 [Tanacetum coccineum]|uniref:Uncharacterized protein n=1 Tax=Tanacetum coccineum TaxID=301880 RepID=A0ABQ4ZQZ6_9ASTR